MSEISDELREINDELFELATTYHYRWAKVYEQLTNIINRIDNEMVELPRYADKKTVHLGDEAYDRDGNVHKALSFRLYDEKKPAWIIATDDDFFTTDDGLTHERPEPPDSLERIADEIKSAGGWCDSRGRYFTNVSSISNEKLAEWASRIRKLANGGHDEQD